MKVKEFFSADYGEVFCEINSWLEDKQNIDIKHIHQVAMPPDAPNCKIESDHMTYLVVSIWYEMPPE